jgi:hypothetical protein
MSTLSQMRSRISDDFNRSDLSTQIDRAINRAISHYRKEHFYFMETSASFSTIANQESYGTADGIPSTINEIQRVEITLTSNNKPELNERTFDYIRERNGYVVTGDPYDYAWYQSKIYLSPIPNSVKTITLYFDKKYTDLSADSDSNDWTTDAEDLIEYHVKADIYLNTLHDTEQANLMAIAEKMALDALRAKTEKLTSSGKIRPTSF